MTFEPYFFVILNGGHIIYKSDEFYTYKGDALLEALLYVRRIREQSRNLQTLANLTVEVKDDFKRFSNDCLTVIRFEV